MDRANYENLVAELAKSNANLVAISKKHSADKIKEVYDWGHRDFGENRAREMRDKHEKLPGDIKWHMVGPLQTNKVKYIIDYVHLIQSVDRIKVLKEIEKRAKRIPRKVNVLLQVHIAEEEQKHGFDNDEILDIVQNKLDKYPHVNIRGLMGMATLTENEDKIRKEFEGLTNLYHEVRALNNPPENFDCLSMGMSNDYQIALKAGSNMVRIGTKVFGPRPEH
jgi:hypothetical protein